MRAGARGYRMRLVGVLCFLLACSNGPDPAVNQDAGTMDGAFDANGDGGFDTVPAPTCADGVRNQDEVDADCGGVCGATCKDGTPCTGLDQCVGVCDLVDSNMCEAAEQCGNGVVESYGTPVITETCDDGNAVDGDGCSVACLMEPRSVGEVCTLDGDCVSSACVLGHCFDPGDAFIKATNTGPGDQFGLNISAISQPDGTALLAVGASAESSGYVGVDGDGYDRFNNVANAAGAVYIYARNAAGEWSFEQYLKASNPTAEDRFGVSVSLTAQENGTALLAVGAIGEDSTESGVTGTGGNDDAVDAGAVYIYARSASGEWSFEQYLKASNTNWGWQSYFGWNVSLSAQADGTALLAVGAHLEDSDETGVGGSGSNVKSFASGAVYIYARNASGVWSFEQYLKATNTAESDLFGWALSLRGQADGTALLAVGAYWEDSNEKGVSGNGENDDATDSGAVYIYARSATGVWSFEQYLKASNTEAGDQFGHSVSLAAHADGTALLAVGAIFEDSDESGVVGSGGNNNAAESGAVYLYTRSAAGVWSFDKYLKASNTGAGDAFGYSVSLSAHADGTALLAVGAYGEDSDELGTSGSGDNDDAGDAGAVYIYARSAAGEWSHQQYLKASTTGPTDAFGHSVSLDAHMDGSVFLASGAPLEDSNALGVDGNGGNDAAGDSGAVYVGTTFLKP